jgi:hypothetical protein
MATDTQQVLDAISAATRTSPSRLLPPEGWRLVGDSVTSIEEGQITLAAPHRLEPGSECGLASLEAYTDITLTFELQVGSDAWFIAKLHQQDQLDQRANSYHLVRHGGGAYLAMHNRILRSLAFPERDGYVAMALSWGQDLLKATVDGLLVAEIHNTELSAGYCFLGLNGGLARLRNIRLEGTPWGSQGRATAALAEGWTPIDGDFSAAAGSIILGADGAASSGVLVSNSDFTEVELGFELLLGAGAIFVAALHQQDRVDPLSNSYHVVYRSDGGYLGRHHTILASLDPLPNGWHGIQMRRAEQRLELSVDGKIVASVTDSQLQSGFCRVGVDGGTARLRNLRLLSLDRMPQVMTSGTQLSRRWHSAALRQADAPPEPSLRPLPFSAMPRRNLLYHVWPARDSIWQWNIEQLKQRIDLFNGHRIMAIMQDQRSDPAEAVIAKLEGNGFDFIVRPNHPYGEAVTFPEMLNHVASRDSNEITFYGHAKGVKYGADVTHAVKRWAEVLYRVTLDDWCSVWTQLQRSVCTGAFRMVGRFRAHHNVGDWHYGGGFFWIRHTPVFSHGEFPVPAFYGGVEAWLGMHFKRDDTGCLFLDELRQLPYHESFWRELGEPAVRHWEASLRHVPPPPDLKEPLPFCGFTWPRLEQHPEEMEWVLERLLAALPQRLLTIGARHGGFEWHVARAFREHGHAIEITTIELEPGQELAETFADAGHRFGQALRVVQADSTTAEARAALGDAGYDAVFIDGDHSYRSVKKDWLLARSSGARLIAFHDIADTHWHAAARCCVSRLWAEIKAEHRTDERISGEWGGIGVVYL